jgi:aspartyl/asparaginyl beta-hydroxylase (cupin superfamily)
MQAIRRIRRTARRAARGTVKSVLFFPLVLAGRSIYRTIGKEQRPVTYDIDQTAPALNDLTQNYAAIKHEVESILDGTRRLPAYHELDDRQEAISIPGEQQRWKVFMLYAMGEKPRANRQLCPLTSELLDKIPNLFQAFFSILEAGKSVPAHCGPHMGILRYHLGLIVPKDNPPSIRIKDHLHTWQEGSSILFDDTWNHEVINHSSGDRVVLLVDTLRPLPWHLHVVNFLYSKVLVRWAYARGVAQIAAQFR